LSERLQREFWPALPVITGLLIAIAAFAVGAFSGYNVSSGRKDEDAE
jgi:hypothetical protein